MKRFLLTFAMVLVGSVASAQNCYTLNGALTCAQPINLLDSTVRSSTSVPVINASQTWNNGGTTFTAVKLNVTNTASNSSSLLMDLQVGATSKFKVDLSGNVTYVGNETITGNSVISGTIQVTGTALFSGVTQIGATDTGLSRLAAGSVAVGNGTASDVTGKLTATYLSTGSGLAVANVGANSCGTSAATIAGGNNAFVITVGATSGTQCRVQFTFAATTEWDCTVTDSTTTIATRATPVDTTHTDFFGAFVAADKVTGLCFPR